MKKPLIVFFVFLSIFLFWSISCSQEQIKIDDITSFTTTTIPKVKTPQFSFETGTTFKSSLIIDISSATRNAIVMYSFDSVTWITGKIVLITETTTLYAKATMEGMVDSDVASAIYISTAVAPTTTTSTVNVTTTTINTTTSSSTSNTVSNTTSSSTIPVVTTFSSSTTSTSSITTTTTISETTSTTTVGETTTTILAPTTSSSITNTTVSPITSSSSTTPSTISTTTTTITPTTIEDMTTTTTSGASTSTSSIITTTTISETTSTTTVGETTTTILAPTTSSSITNTTVSPITSSSSTTSSTISTTTTTTITPTTSTSTTTTTTINISNYFAMKKFAEPFSEQPCIVNLIFGLKDYNGNIIPGIYDTSRYNLTENGLPLAYNEAFYRVKERTLFDVELKTVIMIDISYSVGSTNIEKLKNSVKSIINNKSDNQSIAIYTFSGTVTMVKDFSLDKSELISAVDSITLGAISTNLYGAIYDGLNRFTNTISNKLVTTTFMIVMTDGKDTSAVRTLNDVLTKRGDKSIITVGIGNDVDPQILGEIGNFGSFMSSDFDNLQTYIDEARALITETFENVCWMTYYSPKRAGTHTIELSIKDNSNTGDTSKISGTFSASSPQFYDVIPGIYVNDNYTLQNGISELNFSDGDTSKTMQVNSYFGENEPVYTLELSTVDSYSISEIIPATKKSYSLTRVNGGNVTLTIRDTANSFTKVLNINGAGYVTLDFNSQNGSAVDSQTILEGNLVAQPSAPTRTGYTFAGWYKESGCINQWNFGIDTVDIDTTLFAKWTTTDYNIIYNLNDGTNGSNPATYTIETSTITLQNATKDGYTFGGWYSDVGLSNQVTTIALGSTGDKTLYSKWNINQYTVTFNTNGGSVVSSQTINFGGLVTGPSNPTKTGYTFAGWYKESECINQWNFGVDTVNESRILYAKWLSNNNNLSNLIISNGELTPIFNSGILLYYVNVENNISSISITPTNQDIQSIAQIQINNSGWNLINSGVTYSPINLNIGINNIELKITAEDGISYKIYTIRMNRMINLNNWNEKEVQGYTHGCSWRSICSSSDGTKLAAVSTLSEYKYVFTSSDSGVTWEKKLLAGQREWRSICSSSDGTKLAATVSNGYIYTSSDSGETWVEQINAGKRLWDSICSSSDGSKLAAVVPNGYIYTSSDSGVTWVEHTNVGTLNWHSIISSSDGTKLAIIPNGGYIYTSLDSGATWTERTGSGSRYWTSLSGSGDGIKLAAIENSGSGYIYTSSDSGVTWIKRTSAGLRNWGKVYVSVDGSKFIAGDADNAGYLYISTDNGASWSPKTNAGARSWGSISSSSNGLKIAAVEYYGYLYTTSDGGTNWTEQLNSGYRDWWSITSSSDGTKLAACASNMGYIYTSSDSGDTWIERTSAGQNYWYSLASSANGSKLVILDGNSIHMSNNYGETWVELTSAGNRNYHSITLSSDGTKLAACVNNSGYIYTSSDGGETWIERINSGLKDWWSITSSSDGTKLVACAYNSGYIYTSSDGGETWIEQTDSGDRAWRKITSSSDGTKLLAIEEYGYIYTSSDSGITWIQQTNSGQKDWRSITSSSDGSIIAACVYNDYIYTSIDSGITWTQHTEAGQRIWMSITSSSDFSLIGAVAAKIKNLFICK